MIKISWLRFCGFLVLFPSPTFICLYCLCIAQLNRVFVFIPALCRWALYTWAVHPTPSHLFSCVSQHSWYPLNGSDYVLTRSPWYESGNIQQELYLRFGGFIFFSRLALWGRDILQKLGSIEEPQWTASHSVTRGKQWPMRVHCVPMLWWNRLWVFGALWLTTVSARDGV